MTNEEHQQCYTPGPWRSVETGGDGYFTHRIEITGGHIASIVAWSQAGTLCEIATANARLIEHAPDMAQALRDLLSWNTFCGQWDAPCWQRASNVLRHAAGCTDPEPPDRKQAARALLEQTVPASESWNDHTTLSILLDFLDAAVATDPDLRERLAEHLGEAVAG